MTLSVLMTPSALADLEVIGRWIEDQGTSLGAARWVADIMASMASLDLLPERCPVASEARGGPGPAIRQLLSGQYRILFAVVDPCVIVLSVRHGRRGAVEVSKLAATLRRWLDAAE